jgi:peptide/nickel transport system permease protein
MPKYVIGRLLRSLPLLFGLSLVVFALIHAAPGGPLTVYLSNPNVRPEDIARLEKSLGLDRPVHEQYIHWLGAFLQGDWGYSYVDGRSAFTRIMERVPATLELMLSAFVFAMILAIGAGSWAALRRGQRADRVASTLSFMGISMPTFWLGLVLQLIFAVELQWLPSAGRFGPLGGDWIDRMHHLVLPATTLAVLYASSWMRYVRASLIETLASGFVRAGRARGASDRHVLFRHAIPNALIPLTTVMGLDLAVLFGGAVVTETIFAWPGMGSLLVESVYRRDYSVLMGILLSGSVLIIICNLAIDVVYGWLDPRVRLINGKRHEN